MQEAWFPGLRAQRLAREAEEKARLEVKESVTPKPKRKKPVPAD